MPDIDEEKSKETSRGKRPKKSAADSKLSFRERLRKLASVRAWKSILTMTLYFALSILALHDVFIIVAHSINPNFMADASPYLLEKILSVLLTSFSL